ncbi:MAG: hypothetical protein PSX36_15085 [bacterium]|nr:hypothetical protein [bacterium]
MKRIEKYKGTTLVLLMLLVAGQSSFGQPGGLASPNQILPQQLNSPTVTTEKVEGVHRTEGEITKPRDTCGTRLIFTNGDEVLCTIEEIGATQISFLPCDNLGGPLRKTVKDHVFMIHYVNGSKEVVTHLESKEEMKKPAGGRTVGNNFVPGIPKDVHPKNIDLIVTKNGKQIHCFIDKVSSKYISYHILRHGKDPRDVIAITEVATYVKQYKLTALN